LPFALQPRGMSLRASVMEYHKEADGKCLANYGFHLIITDPSASVLGQELPALVEDGYSSFKVFMTYDDLMLNDRQLLEVFECVRSCRALVMVHCEGYDAIKFMTERLEQAAEEGLDRGRIRCRHRAVGRQPQGGHPAGHPPSRRRLYALRRTGRDRLAGGDDFAWQGGRRGGENFGRAGRRQFSQTRTVALRHALARRVTSIIGKAPWLRNVARAQ
jgi:hypothetical protein